MILGILRMSSGAHAARQARGGVNQLGRPVLVVTFDEGTTSHDLARPGWRARGHRRDRAGRRARPRRRHLQPLRLLRSIETLFKLPLLGRAGDPATATIPALT
jgi:hypothetical protein